MTNGFNGIVSLSANSKYETRNSKQIKNSKIPMSEMSNLLCLFR